MFDACGQCNADFCEACLYSGWALTGNGCYLPTDDSAEKIHDSDLMENIKTVGIVLGVIVGCLVVAAIACGIAFVVMKKMPKSKAIEGAAFGDNEIDENNEMGVELNIL